MKKVIISTLAAAALALAATSCVTVDPVGATGNPVGSKEGRAETMYLFGMLPVPLDSSANGGVKAAAANGGITKISTIDVETNNLLNLIVKKTTIVTGE